MAYYPYHSNHLLNAYGYTSQHYNPQTYNGYGYNLTNPTSFSYFNNQNIHYAPFVIRTKRKGPLGAFKNILFGSKLQFIDPNPYGGYFKSTYEGKNRDNLQHYNPNSYGGYSYDNSNTGGGYVGGGCDSGACSSSSQSSFSGNPGAMCGGGGGG